MTNRFIEHYEGEICKGMIYTSGRVEIAYVDDEKTIVHLGSNTVKGGDIDIQSISLASTQFHVS